MADDDRDHRAPPPDPGRSSEPIGAGLDEPGDDAVAYPHLDDAQLARLRALGAVRRVTAGEILFDDGDSDYDFFVVLSGMVVIVQGFGRENRVVTLIGERRFVGELGLLIGSRPLLAAVVRDAGEVLQVPAAALSELIAQDEELSNLILGAFLARRARLIASGAGVTVVGSRFSTDSRRLREFLVRNRVPHHWMEVEDDPEVDALLQAVAVEPTQTPVVIGAGGVLRNPSNAQLSAALGLSARGAPPAICDVVIVGGGPAGLAAAVYGASEGLDTQAIDQEAFGGQAATSSRIENYLGFPAGISGLELTARAAIQAAKFGARLVVPAEAVGLACEAGHFAIRLADGGAVNARAVVVATGARYRKLDVADLDRHEGVSVHHAATLVEAQLCAGEPVLVVGGGNAAGQAAMFLSRHAASTRLLIRGGDLGRSMSRYLIDEIARRERVEVLAYTEIVELRGDPVLESVVVRDPRNDERRELPARAVFVLIGADPHTGWLDGAVAMDEHGFVLTGREVQDENLAAHDGDQPLFLESNRPGVFAVGDARAGSIKRCASAVGEGSMAIALVHQRLAAR